MHPYSKADARAFWSRSVTRAFDAANLIPGGEPLIRRNDRVISAGSCFASNLVPYLEREGFVYHRTEKRNPSLSKAPGENLGYDSFSAAYGNVYTARQMLQLFRRACGEFVPKEDRWLSGDTIVDPFRPGLRYRARSSQEFDLLTAQHLRLTRQAFEEATVLIFTLGLTEGWVSSEDGAAYPACPGVIAGTFDSRRHIFLNQGVSDVVSDLDALIAGLRGINPALRLILTVSPVPLVATATEQHVLHATIYSKSVLRVAAEEISRRHANVRYFPAYEIVTGPQAPEAFFMPDRRNVSEDAVRTVMTAFISHCEQAGADRQREAVSPASSSHSVEFLADRITAAECDEAMLDEAR